MLTDIREIPPTLLIREDPDVCPDSGGMHVVVSSSRASPHCLGMYVGHPISGIRVARIREMETQVRAFLEVENAAGPWLTIPFFPMRSTHLGPDAIGANVYEAGKSLFSDARHFTMQNRLDAMRNADGVLLNYGIPADSGELLASMGMPFDWGWAREMGKPIVAVAEPGNPNMSPGMVDSCLHVVPDLVQGVRTLNAILRNMAVQRRETVPGGAVPRDGGVGNVVEVFMFPTGRPALDLIARLAAADARKHEGRTGSIVTVMPGGRENPSFHGQVREVSDWFVEDQAQASAVVTRLLGG